MSEAQEERKELFPHEWNARYPVGTRVILNQNTLTWAKCRGFDDCISHDGHTKTLTEAFEAGGIGRTYVVVEGLRCFVPVASLTAIAASA